MADRTASKSFVDEEDMLLFNLLWLSEEACPGAVLLTLADVGKFASKSNGKGNVFILLRI